ncbi:hypothetical protein DFH11DRAFT_936555 [Phellopilus nigrolimitatus]|nr:hypothetical protein DFH11DRAFT_936555 [Phellopilus nigrolimitatus]
MTKPRFFFSLSFPCFPSPCFSLFLNSTSFFFLLAFPLFLLLFYFILLSFIFYFLFSRLPYDNLQHNSRLRISGGKNAARPPPPLYLTSLPRRPRYLFAPVPSCISLLHLPPLLSLLDLRGPRTHTSAHCPRTPSAHTPSSAARRQPPAATASHLRSRCSSYRRPPARPRSPTPTPYDGNAHVLKRADARGAARRAPEPLERALQPAARQEPRPRRAAPADPRVARRGERSQAPQGALRHLPELRQRAQPGGPRSRGESARPQFHDLCPSIHPFFPPPPVLASPRPRRRPFHSVLTSYVLTPTPTPPSPRFTSPPIHTSVSFLSLSLFAFASVRVSHATC